MYGNITKSRIKIELERKKKQKKAGKYQKMIDELENNNKIIFIYINMN